MGVGVLGSDQNANFYREGKERGGFTKKYPETLKQSRFTVQAAK